MLESGSTKLIVVPLMTRHVVQAVDHQPFKCMHIILIRISSTWTSSIGFTSSLFIWILSALIIMLSLMFIIYFIVSINCDSLVFLICSSLVFTRKTTNLFFIYGWFLLSLTMLSKRLIINLSNDDIGIP